MSDIDHKALKERWAALIKEREESGLTIKEWCKERNVKESQYYYWLKNLRRDGTGAAGQEPGSPPFRGTSGYLPGAGTPTRQPCGCYPERGYFHRDNRIRHGRTYCKNYGGCAPCLVK